MQFKFIQSYISDLIVNIVSKSTGENGIQVFIKQARSVLIKK